MSVILVDLLKKHPPKRVLKIPEAARASRGEVQNFRDEVRPRSESRGVIPAVVDAEAVAVEFADEHMVTVRHRIDATDVAVTKETVGGSQKMDDHAHQDDSSRRDFPVRKQQSLLLREGFL